MNMRAVPENLIQQVMNWTGEKHTAPQIVELLKSQYNVTASLHSVYRLIKKERMQRQEAAKAAYVEEIQKTAAQDIKIMSDVVETLYKRWKNDTSDLKTAAELRSWIKDKVVLSGIDKADFASENDAAKDEFLDELNKLRN